MTDVLTRAARPPAAAGPDAQAARGVLEAWNDTARPYPRDASLPALFAAWVARTPEAEAVVHGAERVTYRELDARAGRLAHHLRALGVRNEAPVAVLLDRSVDFVVACLAALRAGGAYLPVDSAFPTRRVEWMLADAGARVLVTTRFLGDGLPTAGAEVVWLDDDAAAIAARPASFTDAQAHPESAACLLYTAGSTAWPRPVAVTHRGVARLVSGGSGVQPGPGDRVAHASGVSVDVTTWDLWGALLNGGTVVVVDREDMHSAGALARVLRDQRVTSVFLTTALFGQVARQAPESFSGVRDVLFGGGAADAEAVRRVLASAAPPRRLANVYGPAENTTCTTVHLVGGVEPGAATLPIGRPVPNTRAYVLNGALQPVPPGEAGELFAAGDGLARGYPGHPAPTAERFVPDPFSPRPGARMYRTGDRARWTAGGELEFLGRLDPAEEVRGARVEPGEVEAVLRAHPGVADAAVVAREDRPGDRRLVAYFVAAPGAAPDAAALRSHARLHLPEARVPAAFVALERIPRDAVGARDRRALPAPGAAPAAAAAAEPRTELERRVAALWAEVLEVERVGVDDSFFDLGGHSLLLMRLHVRLTELAPGVTVLDLFTHPTVASLCALIRGEAAPDAGAAAEGEAARLDAGRERLRARRRIAGGT
ncbi:MAG TPA: non-ribosomal peptide synthetase [Longimicrobium sp.]|jgi:amino acid adenylation domain-containing protein|nr:non-ribosomal peptide synthetase [Longimicrobium sp.]